MPAGTISLALYGATIGKLGVMTFPAATNQACANVVPDERLLDPQYLFFYLMSERDALVDKGQGGAQPNISQQIVKAHDFVLAPLNEQRRIVTKLEKLLSRVHVAQERLATIPRIIKRFRQSVLALACSGRITENWRADNRSSEWTQVTLSDVITEKPKNGYSARPVKHETPWRVLTLTATTSGRFDDRQFKYFDEPIPESSPLWLQPGDILVQRGNTFEYVGVAALYDGAPNEFIYPDLMMRVRANKRIEAKFLYLLLTCEQTRVFLRLKATGTAGNMPKINQSALMSVPILLPSLCEQRVIVRRVEALFRTADALEARYLKAKAHVDKLTQSILAKAFRGELVPQDPNDEPAAVLLERITAQR
jgi:type I restriction enzyme S subunit